MRSAKKRGKPVSRPMPLSDEKIIDARRIINSDEETIGGMASILGVHPYTLARAIQK